MGCLGEQRSRIGPPAHHKFLGGSDEKARRVRYCACRGSWGSRIARVMSSVTHQVDAAMRPKPTVSLRRDEDEFVVSSWPSDVIIFRNRDAEALRQACRLLRWQIVSDTAPKLPEL